MGTVTVTPIEGWNPDQYERFHAERRQPFDDLVALCTPVPGGRVVDLGCGTGNLTVELHERMQAAETVGVDSSESMLARAKANHGDVPGLTFSDGRHRDVARRGSGSGLRQRLAAVGRRSSQPAGAHAHRPRRGWPVGVPGPVELPAPVAPVGPAGGQRGARSSTRSTRTRPRTAAASCSRPRSTPTCSTSSGAQKQVVRMEVYGHELSSTADVVEWVMGTLLTPYRTRLSPELFTRVRRPLPRAPARRAR